MKKKMKIGEKELEEIEARLMRERDTGVQFYPSKFKDTDEGYWDLWHDSSGLRYTQYGKYNSEKENRSFEESVSREQFLEFLSTNDVAVEWSFDDREIDYQKFARDNQIFPLEEIIFKLPRPLATKFKHMFLNDPKKLQKYILDSIIEAIKDDAEAYAYAE